MEKFFNEALCRLEAEIGQARMEPGCAIRKIETIITIILNSLVEVKQFVLDNGFKNMEEEIYFFKVQKPLIVSKLVYYNTIYKIETKKPYGAKRIRKHLERKLKKLKRFFDNNVGFYMYYRNNNSYLDESLFVRGNHDIGLWLDTFYFEADHRFCTSHDFKVAKIIAYDQVQRYLESQLDVVNRELLRKQQTVLELNWTGSKAALTELIYSLYYQGVFDNGSADIQLIARYFENAFNIDLGNFYHTYLEIRTRKINRTKFLDTLREILVKKMDEQEEK